MRQLPISSQTFKIITQYGDMVVVKRSVQQQHNAPHHHPHHYPAANLQLQQSQSSGEQQQQPLQQQQQQQQQHTSRPIIMTFHDLGLNSELQFATFCDTEEVKLMLQTFTIIHVNFIGQEFQLDGQPTSSLPDDFKYPTVEQMAECIVDICAQLRVRSFVALAVGAGAHIVSLLALLRPDLVHGLFLINPVISSCSISEWLCFKMSAIASNHQLIANSHSSHNHSTSTTSSEDYDEGGSAAATPSGLPPIRTDSTSHAHHPSGLRKLWNSVHQQHNHRDQHQHQHKNRQPTHQHNALSTQSEAIKSASSSDDTPMIADSELPTTVTISAPLKATPSSRLRQLILSRNFRLGTINMAARQQQGEPASSRGESLKRRPSTASSIDAQLDSLQKGVTETSRRSSGGGAERPAGQSGSPTGRRAKRPPIEYLMYHHFGSTSFQRVRRPSVSESSPSHNQSRQLGRRSSSCDSATSGQSVASLFIRNTRHDSRGSTDDELSGQDTTESSSAVRRTAQSPRHRHSTATSHSSRLYSSSSHASSLGARHLASFASDRQRTAYMQAVYKQYFTQVNSHNLWLFAHSFIKRHTLNLRKDCGAAAHAAAAAAALGTSICAAFVGMGPSADSSPTTSASGASITGDRKKFVGCGGGGGGTNPLALANQRQNAAVGVAASSSTTKQSQSIETSATSTSSQQQALVAGTKVKRTFTCQTLIMCSSNQIHCERALKLMSLLNPLQATWIKTDQMLVLEEKPEKVCQALRLFLQGIGYSMSTYERRLRLNSTQASISSADSNSSARSLSESSTAQNTGRSRAATATATTAAAATTATAELTQASSG